MKAFAVVVERTVTFRVRVVVSAVNDLAAMDEAIRQGEDGELEWGAATDSNVVAVDVDGTSR